MKCGQAYRTSVLQGMNKLENKPQYPNHFSRRRGPTMGNISSAQVKRVFRVLTVIAQRGKTSLFTERKKRTTNSKMTAPSLPKGTGLLLYIQDFGFQAKIKNLMILSTAGGSLSLYCKMLFTRKKAKKKVYR